MGLLKNGNLVHGCIIAEPVATGSCLGLGIGEYEGNAKPRPAGVYRRDGANMADADTGLQ